MSLEYSGSHQEKKPYINGSNETELSATRNIIKNKFSKAFANRLEDENNMNQAMQPLLKESLNNALSLSIAKQSRPMTTIKADDSKYIKKNQETSVLYIKNAKIIRKSFDNPNELCDRLRTLLSSSMTADAISHEENAIIAKLRELEILL